MDYSAIYTRIIERARNRKLTGYSEKHHIVPRCLGGGNEKSNLVRLRADEHYICHLILARMHPENRKLVFAANMMLVSSPDHCGGRSKNKRHAWLRKAHAKAVGDSKRGIKYSDEVKARMSEAGRLRAKNIDPEVYKESARRLAAINSQKTPEDRSASVKVGWERRKQSDRNKDSFERGIATRRANGFVGHTEESRAKMSALRRGKKSTLSPEALKARAKKIAESRAANGYKQSPETVAKRAATRRANSKEYSPEQRARMSAAARLRWEIRKAKNLAIIAETA